MSSQIQKNPRAKIFMPDIELKAFVLIAVSESPEPICALEIAPAIYPALLEYVSSLFDQEYEISYASLPELLERMEEEGLIKKVAFDEQKGSYYEVNTEKAAKFLNNNSNKEWMVTLKTIAYKYIRVPS